MSNLTETSSFDAGIYKLETTDPVQGGDDTAVSNKQAKALANRTRYLKDHVDALETAVDGILATLATPLTTPAAGSDGTDAATTAFVHRACGGIAVVDVAGGTTKTLTADQWGCGVIILTGLLTANINVIFPTRGDRWLVANRTTGAYKITCKTAAGAGVGVAQTRSKSVWCDNTDLLNEETDLSSRGRVVTALTTLAAGDEVFVDFSGGTFALNLPLAPAEGDSVVVCGDFLASSLTINRNGSLVYNKAGAKVAENIVLNRNGVRAVITYYSGAWFF